MGFMFNIDGGYLEGLCRGFKCGILKQSDYLNLVQCETLEGKKKKVFSSGLRGDSPLLTVSSCLLLHSPSNN
jgi:hypothetical protein